MMQYSLLKKFYLAASCALLILVSTVVWHRMQGQTPTQTTKRANAYSQRFMKSSSFKPFLAHPEVEGSWVLQIMTSGGHVGGLGDDFAFTSIGKLFLKRNESTYLLKYPMDHLTESVNKLIKINPKNLSLFSKSRVL